jgi:hypothetical protein
VGHRNRGFILALALAVAPNVACAGPPFVTDDPEPTDYQHLEAYVYSQGIVARGQAAGSAIGAEINYGAAPDLQISASLPVGFSAASRTDVDFGVTDAEVGAKYRFVEEDDEGFRPQVSFYPSVETALGGSGKKLSDSATHFFLPLWTQKSFGPWTSFGGAGYRINPGIDGRNSWFLGWAVVRRFGECFQLGAETFRETAGVRGENSSAGINVGAIWDFDTALHLVGSAGPEFGRHGNTPLTYYLALEWTT